MTLNKTLKKLKEWIRKLLPKQQSIQLIVKDDLSPLSDFRIASKGIKVVSRQMVVFKKEKDGYYIYLAIQGYQTTLNGILFNEHLPLGCCKDVELESTIAIFNKCNYDIEIKEG